MNIVADKSWKALERRVAALLDTQRTALSGSNGKLTRSDTMSDKYFVEVKYRKYIPFFSTFEETRILAKKEKKFPIVVFHQARTKRNIVMLDLEDFVILEKGE